MVHRLIPLWVVGLVTMAASTLAVSPPASASTGEFAYQANAYGSRVLVASTVKSGPSALVILSCTSSAGTVHTNTAASVSVPPFLTAGAIDTTAKSLTAGVASAGSANADQVSALNGLVTAAEVTSVSTTSFDAPAGAFRVSAAGTAFTNLVVAGTPVTGTPAPNTKISLPGIGYVILNQQQASIGSSSASLTVTGIHVVVTMANDVVPKGTDVVVAAAHSALTGPVTGLLQGRAYGTSAAAGTTVIAGPSFPQPLACLGTGGVTKTNSGASATIPGILTTGAVTNTAEGLVSPALVSGATTSTVTGLNLLRGIVTAKTIKAAVTVSGNPATRGDDSSFLGLSVNGFPHLGDNVAPNTKLSLNGLGTLWLHRQIRTTNGIEVIMVQLIVTNQPNPFGLADGTTVNVAFAQAGVS